jgi:hypothetical protein
MRAISLVAATAALFAAGSACAQAYTGTYTNDPASVKQLAFPGHNGTIEQGGVSFSGVSKTTDATGKNLTTPYTCITWLTPGQPTSGAGVCNGADGAGNSWALFQICKGDTSAPPNTPAACWGELRGTGGAWKGRTGQYAQYGTNAGGTNQGAWNP